MERLFDQRRYLIPFRSTLLPHVFTDTLVIGGGVAGLSAAVAAADHGQVIVLAKGPFDQTNTAWAQGGIAAVLDSTDSFESHIQDTLTAGAGLCDETIIRKVVTEGAARVRELIDWGMAFDQDPSGELKAGREGGHSVSRIYHSGGDATGRELQRCLVEKARQSENLRIFEGCFVLDLLTPGDEPGSPVMGAITFHPRFGLQVIWSRATILASGGAANVYRESTNPRVASADGPAMAYRAGATLADMAFIQFHPTVLYLPGATRALISEAVRGEGAHLLDAGGHRFMPEVHELAELAPRDVVSLAIVRRIALHGSSHVLLDCRHIEHFSERFPGITDTLSKFDLNPSEDLIPVHPAAHYTIGGVKTDDCARTDVPGLYAVGEVSCTGLHGANRLASNSLLEGLVFGQAAGRICAEMASADNGWKTAARTAPVPIISDIPPSEHGAIDLSDVRSSLRSAMWRNVGIERTGPKLHDATDMFDFWARYTLDKIFDDPEGWETQNMLLVCALIAQSAHWREESRGCHARHDVPESLEDLRVHDCWRRGSTQPTLIPTIVHLSTQEASP